MAYDGQARHARKHHAYPPAFAIAGGESGRDVWQYLRANRLSKRVFENHDAIIDASCDAWPKLIAQPQTITSIGMREWAHVGQAL
jgi:hypothetical protein